jgi:hypothetical protein
LPRTMNYFCYEDLTGKSIMVFNIWRKDGLQRYHGLICKIVNAANFSWDGILVVAETPEGEQIGTHMLPAELMAAITMEDRHGKGIPEPIVNAVQNKYWRDER